MKIIVKQTMLRAKCASRLIVFILSLVVLGITYWNNNCLSESVKGWLLGISGSALVWAIVELCNFYIDTLEAYTDQRDQLLGKVAVHFSTLRKLLSVKNISQLDVDSIEKVITSLSYTIHDSVFSGKIYAISDEFQKIYNYVDRLEWKRIGLYQYYKNHREDDALQKEVYKILVKEIKEERDVNKTIDDANTLRARYKKIADIELLFEPYPTPDIVREGVIGNLGETVTVVGTDAGLATCLTSRLDFDFQQIFSAKVKWSIVIHILRRKIKI